MQVGKFLLLTNRTWSRIELSSAFTIGNLTLYTSHWKQLLVQFAQHGPAVQKSVRYFIAGFFLPPLFHSLFLPCAGIVAFPAYDHPGLSLTCSLWSARTWFDSILFCAEISRGTQIHADWRTSIMNSCQLTDSHSAAVQAAGFLMIPAFTSDPRTLSKTTELKWRMPQNSFYSGQMINWVKIQILKESNRSILWKFWLGYLKYDSTFDCYGRTGAGKL